MLRSSHWTCRLSGGCVIWSRLAARPKLPSSATAMNPRSWSRVYNLPPMLRRYRTMPNLCWIGMGWRA